jgi:ArsR family transcriptional regulator
MELPLLYKCLADGTRLRLLNLLRDGPLCGCHFIEVLGMDQVKVSKQLNYMNRMGLLDKEREANWMIYRLAEPLDPIMATNLEAYSKGKVFVEDSERLSGLKSRLMEEGCGTNPNPIPAAVASGCCSLPGRKPELNKEKAS